MYVSVFGTHTIYTDDGLGDANAFGLLKDEERGKLPLSLSQPFVYSFSDLL